MDDFEKRLSGDAEDIRVEVGPELRARIDASVHGAGRVEPERDRSGAIISLWWASSLTGLAAAAVIIAVMNWNRPASVPEDSAAETTVVPHYVERIQEQFPVSATTAENGSTASSCRSRRSRSRPPARSRSAATATSGASSRT